MYVLRACHVNTKPICIICWWTVVHEIHYLNLIYIKATGTITMKQQVRHELNEYWRKPTVRGRVSNIPWSLFSSCSAELSLREFILSWSLESTVRSDQKWLISWKTCGEMTQTNSSYTRESGVKTLTALNDWPKTTIEPSLHQSQSSILCSTPPSSPQTCSI